MQRKLSNSFRWALFVLLLLSPFAAFPQARPPEPSPDPVLTAVMKAEEEGRLADAEKILADAIQQLEKDNPGSSRLSIYLNRLAFLLQRKEKYSDAAALLQRVLEIDRENLGPDSGRVAGDLSILAMIYQSQGKNEEAEQYLKKALEVARANPKLDAGSTLLVLNNLSSQYLQQRRWEEAEPLIQEGLKLCEGKPRQQATSCSSFRRLLDVVYRNAGKAEEADRLVTEAVRQAESSSKNSRDLVNSLNTLAQKYEADKDYSEAEFTYHRAITWLEKNERRDSPNFLPLELDRLGKVLDQQGQKTEAEKVFLRTIELQLSAASPERPDLASDFIAIGLMKLYRSQGRIREMEPIVGRILEIQEKLLGPRFAEVADTLLLLADVYTEQEKNWQARPLYERALDIQETNLGTDHPQLIRALTRYASLLRRMKEDEKAAEIEARMEAIRKKSQKQDQQK